MGAENESLFSTGVNVLESENIGLIEGIKHSLHEHGYASENSMYTAQAFESKMQQLKEEGAYALFVPFVKEKEIVKTSWGSIVYNLYLLTIQP